MLNLSICHKENTLCVDCKDDKCIGAGEIISDCPKYHCDNEKLEDCENCSFIKQFQKEMREIYDNNNSKHR